MEGKCPGRSYCIRGVSGVLLVHQSLLDSLESTKDHQTDSKLHSQRSVDCYVFSEAALVVLMICIVPVIENERKRERDKFDVSLITSILTPALSFSLVVFSHHLLLQCGDVESNPGPGSESQLVTSRLIIHCLQTLDMREWFLVLRRLLRAFLEIPGDWLPHCRLGDLYLTLL